MAASDVAPLRTSDSGRYFVDRKGRPFFWLGDTLWHLCRSFSPEEVRAVLERRKAQGFSAVLVMLLGYEPDPQPNLYGEQPWHDDDPSHPNEQYFAHVDEVMRIACELGMIQVLGVYHKTQDRFYTPERARESARWIAQRYRDVPHIIWSMYPEAQLSYLPTIRAIAEGLAEGDGGAHWVTVHPDPSPQSSSFLHREPWLACNFLQPHVALEQVYPMTLADYGCTPVKPVVMAEGGYEGAYGGVITPVDVRRQAYWTYLAGGHHVYGHDDNWQAPAKWREWIDAPGARCLGVYREVITSLPGWWDVVPDQSIIAKGVRAERELNAAARSATGDWALVYLSHPCTVSLRMDRIKTAETMRATWVDPRDGATQEAGTFGCGDVPEFTSPEGWEDAVVLLTAR